MASSGSPTPAMPVVSVLGRDGEAVGGALEAIQRQWGELAFVSALEAFTHTDYYGGELGEAPVRRFVALEQLTDPAALVQLKRTAGRLEVTLARAGGPRPVNLDPGVLGAHQLVLASTKPRAHRIYLGQGIYGDLMLLWGSGGFEALPWTYPDYAAPTARALFGRLRELFLATRRTSAAGSGQRRRGTPT